MTWQLLINAPVIMAVAVGLVAGWLLEAHRLRKEAHANARGTIA